MIPLPSTVLQPGAPGHPVFPTTGQPSGGWDGVLGEERPEVLTGPLPVYPELLRQARVQGQVLLEAVGDTTGRVLAPSIGAGAEGLIRLSSFCNLRPTSGLIVAGTIT